MFCVNIILLFVHESIHNSEDFHKFTTYEQLTKRCINVSGSIFAEVELPQLYQHHHTADQGTSLYVPWLGGRLHGRPAALASVSSIHTQGHHSHQSTRTNHIQVTVISSGTLHFEQ